MKKYQLLLFLMIFGITPLLAQRPDFIVTGVTGPNYVTPGQSVSVTVTARNAGVRGTQTGTNVVLRMVLSPDNQISLTDNYYSETNIPITSFDNGVTVTRTFSYTIPNGLNGVYYWGAYIDANNYWIENNENNNAYTGNDVGINVLLISPTQTKNPTWTADTILFQWRQPVTATRYELLVDNKSDFSSPEVSKTTKTELANYTQTSYILGANWLQPNKTYYWKVTAFLSGGTQIVSETGSFLYNPTPASFPVWTPLYRSYNKLDIEHFLSADPVKLKYATDRGFNFEGVNGYISSRPFTVSAAGDTLKAIYSFYIKDTKTPPQNRYNRHYYTIDQDKRDNLIANGTGGANEQIIYEGIVGYTYKLAKDGMTNLLQLSLSKNDKKDNLFTISETESKLAISRFGYTMGSQENIYVSLYGGSNPLAKEEQQPEAGKGINILNGNLNYSNTGFKIPGGRLSLDFSYYYNTFTALHGNRQASLGFGWSHTYSAYMVINPLDNQIYVYWQDGNIHVYDMPQAADLETSSNSYGVYDKLNKLSDNQYTIKKTDQTIYKFSKLNPGENVAFLESVTDRNGNALTCIYDALYRLTRVTSPEGRNLQFRYYDSSVTISEDKRWMIKDVYETSLGSERKISFEYDANLNLIRYTDQEGNITQYSYDTRYPNDHLLKNITFPRGNLVMNDYPASYQDKRILSQKIGDGSTLKGITLDYSTTGQVRVTNELDKVYTYYYQSIDNPVLTKLVTPMGKTTEYQYTDPKHKAKPTAIKDAKGVTTNYSYDSNGNLIVIEQPTMFREDYVYNTKNDVTKYTNRKRIDINYSYDSRGNLISVVNPRSVTRYTYNTSGAANGTVSTMTDGNGKVTTYSYNGYGNLSSIRDNGGFVTAYNYDAASRLTEIINPIGKSIKYTYTKNDLIKTYVDEDGRTTTYNYDGNKNMISIVNVKNKTTNISYNSKDLAASLVNTLGMTTRYDYRDDGLLLRITKPGGENIQYSYDNDSYISGYSIPGYNTTIYYDNNGNITSSNDNNGTLRFTDYDVLNRLKSYTDYFGNTVSYLYDANGNITRITYPGNKSVMYEYYDDDLLKAVTDWYMNRTEYTYLSDGSLSTIQYANGITATYKYDNAGRYTELINKTTAGDTINYYKYSLDNLGNEVMTSRIEPLPVLPMPNGSFSYVYDDANRIVRAGTESFTFDNNGNMKQRTGSKSYTYTFDALNRLIGVTGSNTAGYSYDYMGNRRAAIRDNVVRRYALDVLSHDNRVLIETDGSNTPVTNYIYGLGLISKVNVDNSVNYYHYDSRGSIIAITDKSQKVLYKYSYSDFGEVSLKAEPSGMTNPFRYVGARGVTDEGNGLYYMHARYYDWSTGRFISESPMWSTNLFLYGKDNPLNRTVPNGIFEYPVNTNNFFFKSEAKPLLPVIMPDSSNILVPGISFLSF